MGTAQGLGGGEAGVLGGEAQRAALVCSPELLLLDGPFGALDALPRLRMHGLLRKLCARHRPAVLLATHDVDEALALADRVLVLTDGRISHVLTPRPEDARATARLRRELLEALGAADPDE